MIKIVLNEALISFATALIGVISLTLTLKGRSKLSAGTFKTYINYYLAISLLLLGFAIWKIMQALFNLTSFRHIYTEYAFLSLIFIIFGLASRKMFIMSKEFGFSEKTDKIRKILRKKRLRS